MFDTRKRPLIIVVTLISTFWVNATLSQERIHLDEPGIYSKLADNLLKDLETCKSVGMQQKEIECSVKKLWKFTDVSLDDHLSTAELNRFFRILSANFAYEKYIDDFHTYKELVKKDSFAKQPENHEILVAIASGAFGAILTPILIANADYDNDGLLSRSEIFQDTEWKTLIASMQREDGKLPKNLEQSLKKLRMMLLPLLLNR